MKANWFGSSPEARVARKPFDFARFSHWVAAIAVGMVLVLILLNLVLQTYLFVIGEDLPEQDTDSLAFGLIVNMGVFIGAPFLWVVVMYHGGRAAWRSRLFLQSHNLGLDILIGIGAGLASLAIAVIVVFGFQALGLPTENPVVEELGASLTWGLVFFIPFAAATSEEIFFRGFLQPRIGIVPANLLFGLVHLSYGTPIQVIAPMLLGFFYSWTVLVRRSVLPAMIGHFLFNLTALTATKLAHDLGAV